MSAAEHLVELPPVSPGLVRLVEPDEPTLVAAEAAVEEHDHDRALELLARVRLSPGRTPALAVRALCAEAWTRMERGELRRATELLERARAIADSPGCAELEQAEVLFRLGCCRLALGSAANAASLLAIALDLCDHS